MSLANAHIDCSRDLEGEAVVLAVFDLDDEKIGAAAHAVTAAASERYRTASLGTDDVLALRELTALTDELGDLAARPGMRTVVMRPARLNALRDAVAHFVDSRDTAEWLREEDREPLALVRGLLHGLEDLAADAMRAALTGSLTPRPC